jgi:hypothetical protein
MLARKILDLVSNYFSSGQSLRQNSISDTEESTAGAARQAVTIALGL